MLPIRPIAGLTFSIKIVSATRFRPLFIAFHADYYEHIHVARAFVRLFNLYVEDAFLMNS